MDNVTADSDIVANLEAAFAQPVDNNVPVKTTTAEEPVVTTPEQPEEQPVVEQPQAEPAQGEPAPEPEKGFLTRQQIEETYARSNTVALRNLTADYAEQGEALKADLRMATETIDKLGGEPFIEPAAKMIAGLQSDDGQGAQSFFEGILDAAGEEAMKRVIAHSIHFGFVQADEWVKNPETAEFGKALNEMVDVAVQEKFGHSISDIKTMMEWQQLGWPERLQGWMDRYAADPDSLFELEEEFDEMLQIHSQPEERKAFKSLVEERNALKSQQETKAEKPKATPTVDDRPFNDYAFQAIGHVNEKVVWKDSPLLDHETDTPDMKAAKSFFRNALTQQTFRAFQASAARSQLALGFRTGQSTTAMYQKALTDTLDEVIQKTAPDRVTAEKILAAMYGKTRNAKLVNSTVNQPASQPYVPAIPTVPTNFAPTGVKTDDQIVGDLENAFASFGR